MNRKSKAALLLWLLSLLTGCDNDSAVASRNLSAAANQFELMRRIVFYNSITGEYLISIEGFCSVYQVSGDNTVTVTCKTAPATYKKHYIGLSGNVTFFAEQINGAAAGVTQYRAIFKPESINREHTK